MKGYFKRYGQDSDQLSLQTESTQSENGQNINFVKCEFCNKNIDEKKYADHKIVCPDRQRFECKKCGIKFLFEDHLESHLEDHANESPSKNNTKRVSLANIFMKSKTLETKKTRNVLVPSFSNRKDSSFVLPKQSCLLPLIDERFKPNQTPVYPNTALGKLNVRSIRNRDTPLKTRDISELSYFVPQLDRSVRGTHSGRTLSCLRK